MTKVKVNPQSKLKEEVKAVLDATREVLKRMEKSSDHEVVYAIQLAWAYMELCSWHMQIGAESLFKADHVKAVEERGRHQLAELKEALSHEVPETP